MNVIKLQRLVEDVTNHAPSRMKAEDVLMKHLHRKYPQFQQNEIFSLQDAFRKLDVEDRGYLDEATVIKATQQSERQSYDVVRQALKEVELDSSRRVELEDYVDVSCALLEIRLPG
jgi:Ca2+-binding EF-hand superfamily protein